VLRHVETGLVQRRELPPRPSRCFITSELVIPTEQHGSPEKVLASDRFWRIVLKNSVLKPTVIADSFRPVGAGDRIDDGSAAG
jgi:hypothetical protein